MFAEADRETMIAYTEDDLASARLGCVYAAYIRAHGFAVPEGRGDLFDTWLRAERQTYFRAVLGREIPFEPASARKTLAYGLAVIEHYDPFEGWIKTRYPAPGLLPVASPHAGDTSWG